MTARSIWVVEPLALGPASLLVDAPGPGWTQRGLSPIPVPPDSDPIVIKPLADLITAPPSSLPAPRRQTVLVQGTPVAHRIAGSVERAEPVEEVATLGPQPEPQAPARAAETSELSRNAASLVREAEKRSWSVSAAYARGSALTTVMVEDPGAPLTPTGRKARKASVDWQLVESIVVRLRSPLDDRAVFVFEDGSPAGAWVAPRGASGFTGVGYRVARAFVLGPWGVDMGYVPAWRRELIKNAKRHAKSRDCAGCGSAVMVGFDALDDVEQVAVVDAEPIEATAGAYALLTEIVSCLTGRDVYSAIKAGGGVELTRRDDFSIGSRRWPTHLAHQCSTLGSVAA